MTIELLGRSIPVKDVAADQLICLSGDSNSIGFWDGEAIYILNSLTADRRKRVLTHEMVHAILAISGLTNLLEDKLEEAIADSMEALDAYVSL